MNDKELIKTSKFMSLVLRHQPESLGIILDESGWTDLEEFLEKMNKKGYRIDFEQLKYLVENNNKKRFALSDDLKKIRASQGHSVEVDLGYEEKEPPEILYHGTAEKNISSIKINGIAKQKRHHVHLSMDKETAANVGGRHGKPLILSVNSGNMYRDGLKFYLSANNVWLTDYIAPKYIFNF